MAKVKFSDSYDMSKRLLGYSLFDFDIRKQTSRKIVVDFGDDRDTYIGKKITYSNDLEAGGRVTGGVITGFKYSTDDVKNALVATQFKKKVRASRLYKEIAQDDAQGAFSYVLRGNDKLIGSKKDDVLIGYKGNDKILGKAGDDSIFGGKGNDYLNAFKGAGTEFDSLTGGSGRDTFVLGNKSKAFYENRGFARIKDFESGKDKIQINGDISDYSLGVSRGDTTIRNEDGNLIAVIEGVRSIFLTGDFVSK